MATTRKQKTASGGSVAGSLNGPMPGSPIIVASLAILRARTPAVKPSSILRCPGSWWPGWLAPVPK